MVEQLLKGGLIQEGDGGQRSLEGLYIFSWYISFYDQRLIYSLYRRRFEAVLSDWEYQKMRLEFRNAAYKDLDFLRFISRPEHGAYISAEDIETWSTKSDREKIHYMEYLLSPGEVQLGTYQSRHMVIDYYRNAKIGRPPFHIDWRDRRIPVKPVNFAKYLRMGDRYLRKFDP